jgi:hypothetical protein
MTQQSMLSDDDATSEMFQTHNRSVWVYPAGDPTDTIA